MKSKSIIILSIFLVIAVFVLLSVFVGYYGDWLWFQNMGYGGVFTTILWTKIPVVFCFLPHIWNFCLGKHYNRKETRKPNPILESAFR